MIKRHIACICVLVCAQAVGGPGTNVTLAGTASANPKTVLEEAAAEIRREALLPPNGPAGRPLPLVSHWNMGSQGRGWTPQYQVELLHEGHHILPWFGWPQVDPNNIKGTERFHDYYDALIGQCRQFNLPLSFRGTQWEAMLVKNEYTELPPEQCPAVITSEGKAIHKLSPFGPIEPWRDPARRYIDTPGMKTLQWMYPDPPLVLLVSNNEAPDLRWHQVELSQRYLGRFGKGRSDEFKRRVVAKGWMQRYPVMFQAMREALVSDKWEDNVRFVGYGAFGPSHFGRWSDWKEYSLITDEWTSPDWHIWDGGSPSYYTHNWNDNRDHWVFSTQIESMNWIFQLEEAWKVNPDFWWEISTWDGNASNWTPQTKCTPEIAKKSKACQYMLDGQTYSPQRYSGWVQFGMWLLRPRAIREFRGSTTPLEPWRPFFERLLFAVDRIYANSTLEYFWRHGKLVANPEHQHPYQVDIPEKYRSLERWFLLDTSLDPRRPWEQHTNIPVFSLALVTGDKGNRRWLVYAHSPLEGRRDVTLTVPGFGKITIDVSIAGSFYIVDEKDAKTSGIED